MIKSELTERIYNSLVHPDSTRRMKFLHHIVRDSSCNPKLGKFVLELPTGEIFLVTVKSKGLREDYEE